ncbi:MAG: mechanosensitive ion channel [Sideroxydans sp.]|nr:mechanosensitive ion channel [Sideroxydans sp.]
MSLEKFWEWLESLDGSWGLSIQVFSIVLLTLLLDFVARKVLDHLLDKLKLTENPWDDTLVDALRRPASVLIWVIGISLAAELVYHDTHMALFAVVTPIRNVAIIYCIAWFLIRFVKQAEANIIINQDVTHAGPNNTSISALAKLVRVSIIISASLVALETLGFSISGVLAFGGVGGIAVGFAAKDLLANFFGGLMVHLDRPFAVGDWIRSPDRQIEGTVEDIGWRLTRIRTFDKRPLYLPNSTFTTIAVENPSRMSHRRIYETIGIRYDDAGKMRAIVQDVKQMLLEHEEIDQAQTMIINFDKFAASSLDFFIYVFTRTTNWIHYHEVKQDVLLKVLDIVAAHGAEVAFPTSTLHIPEGVRLFGEEQDVPTPANAQ